MSKYFELIKSTLGFERVWAYVSWTNERDGYYTPDELIDLSLTNNFRLDNPLTRIRKGTKIMENAIIKNGSVVDGKNVIVGDSTILDQARIIGSNIEFGKNNFIQGNILIDNIRTEDSNKIKDIQGKNISGKIRIGNHNIIENIIVNTQWENSIYIGDNNQLHPGLTLNNPFSIGSIFIGDNNDLGNGGGAVISSSFRYAKGWGGHVVIGSNVEMTRGAEIGGLSLVGWDLDSLQRLGYSQERLITLFTEEEPSALLDCLQKVSQSLSLHRSNPKPKKVGFFGAVKTKRCCIIGYARIRDDVRVQGSYLRNTEIRERCKILYSAIGTDSNIINLNISDTAIENQFIFNDVPWGNYSKNLTNDEYLQVDYDFYKSKEHSNP